jgi:hypothetical protein
MNKRSSSSKPQNSAHIAIKNGDTWTASLWSEARNTRWLRLARSQNCTVALVASQRPKRAWRFFWK